MFGPPLWTDTLLVSAVSRAERREHRDTAALGEAEIQGEISQSRERVRRVVHRGAGVCVCLRMCLCVWPLGGCSGWKVFVYFWGFGILKMMCSCSEESEEHEGFHLFHFYPLKFTLHTYVVLPIIKS